MIVVKIWGGIGNQLFQYVYGEYLHYKYGQEVRYDDNSYVSNDKLRKSELLVLNKDIVFDNRCTFSRFRGVKNRVMRVLYQLQPDHHYIAEGSVIPETYEENHLYFFQGYWQDYKYYEWLCEHVGDFQLSSKWIPEVLQPLKEQIQETEESVSVHVRRGDYFKPENIKKYGVCDAAYFENAIQKIEKRIKAPKFFIFSDDLEWVKSNINLPQNSVLIPNYDIDQFLYIELMSFCKHHIISNSSFSWWGAVINSDKEAITICPSRWVLTSDETIALDKWTKI